MRQFNDVPSQCAGKFVMLLSLCLGLALNSCGGGSTAAVDNNPASVVFTSVGSTTTGLTVNMLCADPDGLFACSYAITPNDTTTIPIFTLFANKTGGDVTFTRLADGSVLQANTTYKTWARVLSFKSLLNNNGTTDFFQRFATQITAQVPPIMGNISNTSVANGVAVSIDASASVTLTNGDAVTVYTLGGSALPTGLSFNTTTGLLSGTTTVAGVYNFTMTATDNDGVSNVDNFTLTVTVALIPNTAPTAANAVLDLAFAAEVGIYDMAPDIADAESADNLLTINVITPVAQGSLIWAGTQFAYHATQSSGYIGNDSFTYNVQDPQGLTSATMTIVINNILENGLPLPINTAPIAANVSIDLLSAAETATYDLAPDFADFESADNLLTINVITPPAQGTLFWTGTQFTYTATGGTGYAGNDNFTYNIQDLGGLTNTIRTVAINNIQEDGIISTPTIAIANQTVNDNGGFISTALPAPTVTGVSTGAVYSIVADPTAGMLTINATGVAIWSGNLTGPQMFLITIKVTNPDTGTQSVTFTLTVINNG